MNIKIPGWVNTTLWIIGIVFSAFFLGSLLSVILKDKLAVPREIITIKKTVDKPVQKKTIFEYEQNIVPIFGEVKAPQTAAVQEAGWDDEFTEPENPAVLVNWEQVLSNPDQIKLKGTIIGSETALAFLNVGGTDMTVEIGQMVGDYQIDTIMKGAVIFKRGEMETILSMELSDNPTQAALIPANPIPPPLETQRQDDLENIVTESGGKMIVDRRKFSALLTPPSRLAHDLKFIPNSKDGEPYGLKLSYLKADTFFTKLGLRTGDILVKANNKEIKTIEDSFETYQMFRNEDHMTLEVDRGGQMLQIPIEFR